MAGLAVLRPPRRDDVDAFRALDGLLFYPQLRRQHPMGHAARPRRLSIPGTYSNGRVAMKVECPADPQLDDHLTVNMHNHPLDLGEFYVRKQFGFASKTDNGLRRGLLAVGVFTLVRGSTLSTEWGPYAERWQLALCPHKGPDAYAATCPACTAQRALHFDAIQTKVRAAEAVRLIKRLPRDQT